MLYLLQALIADKFDPDKVDTLLHTRKGPPKWLTPLIADRAGRELIYTLSARYKNCQLLKYAMQRILKAGHDDEVASVGSRLSGYFEVFHNLMEKRLEEMLTADDARMQVLSRELLVNTCYVCIWSHKHHVNSHIIWINCAFNLHTCQDQAPYVCD